MIIAHSVFQLRANKQSQQLEGLRNGRIVTKSPLCCTGSVSCKCQKEKVFQHAQDVKRRLSAVSGHPQSPQPSRGYPLGPQAFSTPESQCQGILRVSS